MSLSKEIQVKLSKDSDSHLKQVETPVEYIDVRSKDLDQASNGWISDENGLRAQTEGNGVPKLVGGLNEEQEQEVENRGPKGRKEWFAYIKTKQFWVVLLFG